MSPKNIENEIMVLYIYEVRIYIEAIVQPG
jgi:hypothetical protein